MTCFGQRNEIQSMFDTFLREPRREWSYSIFFSPTSCRKYMSTNDTRQCWVFEGLWTSDFLPAYMRFGWWMTWKSYLHQEFERWELLAYLHWHIWNNQLLFIFIEDTWICFLILLKFYLDLSLRISSTIITQMFLCISIQGSKFCHNSILLSSSNLSNSLVLWFGCHICFHSYCVFIAVCET